MGLVGLGLKKLVFMLELKRGVSLMENGLELSVEGVEVVVLVEYIVRGVQAESPGIPVSRAQPKTARPGHQAETLSSLRHVHGAVARAQSLQLSQRHHRSNA